MWGNGKVAMERIVRLARLVSMIPLSAIVLLLLPSLARAGTDDDDLQPLRPGHFTWASPAQGFDVTEVPVLEQGREVERIHIARIDPSRFVFEVHTSADGARNLSTWLKVTGAVLIVNGSYFDRQGYPATPVISRGRTMGPTAYGTKHGAFVVTASGPTVLDLARTRWHSAFRGASEAMVSFPMLIGADGKSRASRSNPSLLANRSFVGQDGSGRILIGTTTAGYFSLGVFAEFLADSGLDLKRALNLDGGPPACQAVAIGTFRRSVCSNFETSSDVGQLNVLRQLFGQRPWGLPIVLAVLPK
jgi:hypothetical protein